MLAAAGLLWVRTIAVGQAAVAQSPASIFITTNYYIFGGTNHAQMRAAMAAARPWKQTMAYDALTQWDIQSNYRYWRDNSEFKLCAIDVRTKVDMTLPLWIPGKPVSRALLARWQRRLVGLTVHEQGHLQLALAAGAAVRRRLEELAGFPSAQALVAAAQRAQNDTIDEFRRQELKYDQETEHGRTQEEALSIQRPPVQVLQKPNA